MMRIVIVTMMRMVAVTVAMMRVMAVIVAMMRVMTMAVVIALTVAVTIFTILNLQSHIIKIHLQMLSIPSAIFQTIKFDIVSDFPSCYVVATFV